MSWRASSPAVPGDPGELLLRAAPVGLALLDRGLRFLAASEPLAALVGVPVQSLAGRTLEEALPQLGPALEPLLRKALETGRRVEEEVRGAGAGPAGEAGALGVACEPVRANGSVVAVCVALRDATRERLASESRRLGEERYRLLFENCPLPILVFDLESLEFLALNPASTWKYQHSREEFLRLTARDLYPPELVPSLLSFLAAFPREVERTGTTRHRKKDGTLFDLELTCRALVLGGRPAVLALVRDVSERLRVETSLEEKVRALEQADRKKDEFLGLLAHELRNPMAPIQNAAEVLRLLGPDDPTLELAREVVERQVRQLARLVDDFLDLSRIARGKIQLQRRPVDASRVAARAVEAARPLIDSLKHRLTISLAPEPLIVDADPERLAQVLSSLLHRAASSTEEGGQLRISVEREGERAVFRVGDSGRGIPPEMLPNIFELYTRPHSPLDRSLGGLAVALTLVRRLAEMHGGQVEAFSAGRGQGSEFVVRLPLLPGGAPAPPPPRPAEPVAERKLRRRVLLVEDNADSARSLALFLQARGYQVETARDGPSSLEAARSFRPEVVLLDIGLPGMDGYEVAQRLRQEPEHRDVLMVALTGYGDEEDRQRSSEAGFDHHVVKPVEPQLLEELLTSPRRAEARTPR